VHGEFKLGTATAPAIARRPRRVIAVVARVVHPCPRLRAVIVARRVVRTSVVTPTRRLRVDVVVGCMLLRSCARRVGVVAATACAPLAEVVAAAE